MTMSKLTYFRPYYLFKFPNHIGLKRRAVALKKKAIALSVATITSNVTFRFDSV